jgi:hypothetical protein
MSTGENYEQSRDSNKHSKFEDALHLEYDSMLWGKFVSNFARHCCGLIFKGQNVQTVKRTEP